MIDCNLNNVKINLIEFLKKNKKNIEKVLDELRLDYEDDWDKSFYRKCEGLCKLFVARNVYLNTGNKYAEETAFILAGVIVDNLYDLFNGLYNDLESALYELRNVECKKNRILVKENRQEKNSKK